MSIDKIYWQCPKCGHSYKWRWDKYNADHDTWIGMHCEDGCGKESKGTMYRVGERVYAVVFKSKGNA
jgi:hypothetical protein